MTTPKISVLIPTYNYAQFIGQAVQSLREQEFTEFEVIISDDASSDNTPAIVEQLIAGDERFIFHRQTRNLGMVNNWNWCLEQARGEYVQYLFGDDFFTSPKTLGRLYAELEKHPSAALAASARWLANEYGQLGRPALNLGKHGLYPGANAIWACLTEGENKIGEPSVVMFRKKLAQRGFDPQYKQLVDLEMWLYLCRQGDLIFVDEPLCAFRQHCQQQTVINTQNKSTKLELYRLFKSYLPWPTLENASYAKRLTYRTGVYRIMRRLKKDGLASAETIAAHQDLATLLPNKWRWLVICNYRAQRISANIRRAINKRLAK